MSELVILPQFWCEFLSLLSFILMCCQRLSRQSRCSATTVALKHLNDAQRRYLEVEGRLYRSDARFMTFYADS